MGKLLIVWKKGARPFFKRVLAAYAKLAQEEPDRIVVFDGTLPVDVLHEQIWADFRNTWRSVDGTRM